jgi:hypothetical protein
MKKIIVSLLLLSILVLPITAMAIPTQPGEGDIGDIEGLYDKIGTVAWVVFAMVALICFLIAGILFLTAAGNPAKIAIARNAFLWGVAGVVVGVIAFSIVKIVQNAL